MFSSYTRIVRSPLYFPVWLGGLVSNLGDTVNYVALVIDVYRLTGSGLALSTLVIFQVVPVIVIGPIAGPIVDRFSRKHILIAADLTRPFLAIGMVFADTAWQLDALAFLMAAATVFFTPALSASIPALIEGDDLLAANSVSWSTAQSVQIIGSAVSGGIIASTGVGVAFGVNALSFLVSAFSISLVAFPLVENSTKMPYMESLHEGMRYAFRDTFVARMFSVQLLASLSVGGTSALLVVLAEHRYHLPATGFAGFLIAIAAGALVGPFILRSATRNYRNTKLLFFPYIVRGVGDILLGVVTLPFAAQVLLFAYGLNTSSGMVTYQSAMQSHVPDAMRGRVFTLMDTGWNASRVVSVALAGVLADRLGIAVVYYLGGLLLIAAGIVGLTTVRMKPDVQPQILH